MFHNVNKIVITKGDTVEVLFNDLDKLKRKKTMKKSYMIELDTDCDLNSDNLQEKYGERFFKSNERCVFWIISDDVDEMLSDIEAETKSTKLEGLIEYFREIMWSGECDTNYGNYEIILSTYRMPLEELQQNFNGFKKINEGM